MPDFAAATSSFARTASLSEARSIWCARSALPTTTIGPCSCRSSESTSSSRLRCAGSQFGKSSRLRYERGVDGNRCHRATRRGDDRQLWTRRDVSRRVHVLHRRVIAVIDDKSPHLVAFASELRAEIIGGILADREVESLAIE